MGLIFLLLLVGFLVTSAHAARPGTLIVHYSSAVFAKHDIQQSFYLIGNRTYCVQVRKSAVSPLVAIWVVYASKDDTTLLKEHLETRRDVVAVESDAVFFHQS